jgi:hypothetical protein
MARAARRQRAVVGAWALLAAACGGEPPRILDPGPQSVRVGERWSIQLRAVDDDSDDLSFSIEAPPVVGGSLVSRPLPDGQSIELDWTPTEEAVGQHVVIVGVSDEAHESWTTILLEVDLGAGGAPIWQRPTGTGVVLDLDRDACIEVELLVEDRDTPSVELRQAQGPASATVSPTAEFEALWSWCPRPDELDRNNHRLLFVADDGSNDPVELPFVVALRGQDIPDPTLPPDDGPDSGPGDSPADDPDAPGDVPGNNCCSEATTPGCASADVQSCVCDDDAYCCDTAWDELCVQKVDELGCGTCSSESPNPAPDSPSVCCEASTAPGCTDDAQVQQCICDADSYCCSTAWDAYCVSNIELLSCGTC